MAQRKVIRETKIFNGDDRFIHPAPVGMVIEGRQDGTRWYCTFAQSYPVIMKFGWWVAFLDTIALTAQLPTAEEYILHVKDGVTRKFIPE